ncbi:hypothetical protein [Roseibium sp.]|uniref:hypothetical protein n=1 Tax=Roseibium sp. TaxID=1936156 RepID=UPI001B153293|nr:hypothetical protein [Roseibium sp.]MBO6858356.1 hypothetical protein [Roseibium sp.]
MAKQMQIAKADFNEILELMENFKSIAMSSYYSSDIQLQEDAKRVDEILGKYRNTESQK